MQNLSNFLLIYSIVLFVVILSKSAKLLTDYLLTKLN